MPTQKAATAAYQLVDHLSLEMGIMHQDIAPRNLLVDPETDKIILIDFNGNSMEARSDGQPIRCIRCGLHAVEIITNDTTLARIPHCDRSIDIVLDVERACRCDDVSVFREFWTVG